MTDLAIFPWTVMTDLASNLCRELRLADRPEPCFCGVLGGSIVPLDYCQPCSDGGKCGMAWVRATSLGHDDFVLGRERLRRKSSACATPLFVTLEVGVARCAPTLDEQGDLPSMAEQFDAAQGQTLDMLAALKAVRCYDSITNYDLHTWTPMGPEGGCLGGTWSLNIYED